MTDLEHPVAIMAETKTKMKANQGRMVAKTKASSEKFEVLQENMLTSQEEMKT
jgi:hypothetical protein